MATETKKPFLKRTFDVLRNNADILFYTFGMSAFFLYVLNGVPLK